MAQGDRQAGTALGTVTANLTGTAATRTWDRKHDGSWQQTSTATKFDDEGRAVEDSDLGEAAPGDEECTTTSYADNATDWLRALPKQVEVLDVACGRNVTYPAHLLSRRRNTYDALAFGATPTRGLLSKREELTGYTGTTPNYRSKSTGYDSYGRVRSTSDSSGASSTTVFTPATTTKPDTLTVTGTELVAGVPSSAQSVVTEFDGVRSLPTATVDANGKRSEAEFDALGRLTKAWLANRPKASSPTPNLVQLPDLGRRHRRGRREEAQRPPLPHSRGRHSRIGHPPRRHVKSRSPSVSSYHEVKRCHR